MEVLAEIAASTADPCLPAPARYFPPTHGRYEVTAGLRRLGTDCGGGTADALAFQLDREFPRYRANKLAARAERPGKYVLTRGFRPETAAAVTRWFLDRLPHEHPQAFQREDRGGETLLRCRLTGESLRFTAGGRLAAAAGPASLRPPYASAFDALCCQVQEDVAVVQEVPGSDSLVALHVCAPSYWSPEEKIGGGFAPVHAPVPGIAPLLRGAPGLVRGMIEREPTVRFVWGVAGVDRLNHHPEPPPGVPPGAWRVPAFGGGEPPFYFRVERQVLWGLPEVRAALFLIRVSLTPAGLLSPDQRAQLAAAVRSMSPESRAYKGLEGSHEALLRWLDGR